MINVEFEIDPNVDTPNKKIASELIIAVLSSEKKNTADVLVIFTSDKALTDLKKKFFNKEHLTDVIAFRMNEYEEEKVEGEIYISIPRAKENAIKFKEPFNRELGRLIIHGCLHLLGFKDESNNEKIEMRDQEDHYLDIMDWKNIYE